MRVELHCHSICSDGELPPLEVGRRAREREVDLFCLTDHDTCAGSADAIGELPDAITLRGVEMTCHEGDAPVHLLVYDVEKSTKWNLLEEFLVGRAAARRDRLRHMGAKLLELGFQVDLDQVFKGRTVVGRPHLAKELVRIGAVATESQAFQRLIGDNGPAFVPNEHLSVGEGLKLARDSGGKVSLAHPHSRPDAEELLRKYKEAGLTAVEAFYGPYKKAKRRSWLRVAEDLGLVATGGSDFHSDSVPRGARFGVDMPELWAKKLKIWLQL